MQWLAALEESEANEVRRAVQYIRHSRRKSPQHHQLLALAKVALIADRLLAGRDYDLADLDRWREIEE